MKKVYIAYKFTGADLEQLKSELNYISSIISKTGNKAFIFNRDIQNWGNIQIERNNIMKIAEKEMDSSDIVFAFVNNPEKSEGMLLEIGMAKAKGKKIILALKDGIQLYLSETIVDDIIRFKKIEEIENIIPNFL